MAKLIEEPRSDAVEADDWKKFLYRTTRQGGGFICIGLTNMDSGARPQIAAGSRLEINGAVYENKESFYEAAENEDIAGKPSGSGRQYVYAVPSSEAGETCSFKFSQDKPEWSAAKGGWYKGNDRAVAKLDYFSDGNQYNYKVILDSYNAMENLVAVDEPSASSIQTVAGTRPLIAQLKTLIDNIAQLFSSPTFTGIPKVANKASLSSLDDTASPGEDDIIAVAPSTDEDDATNLPVGTYVSVKEPSYRVFKRNEAVRVILSTTTVGYPNVYTLRTYAVSDSGGEALDGTWRLSGTTLARRVL